MPGIFVSAGMHPTLMYMEICGRQQYSQTNEQLICLICQATEPGFYQWRVFNHLQGSVIRNVSTKYIIIQLAHGSRLLKIACVCTTVSRLKSKETWQLSLPCKTVKQRSADGSSILTLLTTAESGIQKKKRQKGLLHVNCNLNL